MNILGVDDSPDILQFEQMLIESIGHNFESVEDGRRGLEMIRTRKFDMVFLDLSMPDFSGLDVIDALEKDGILKECNIVLFTASYLGVTEMRTSLLSRGVRMVLTKPADIDTMIKAIQKIESGS